MSIFSDIQVKKMVLDKKIIIDPYFEVFQGPNCYHCHLGNKFKRINKKYIESKFVFDPLEEAPDDLYQEFETNEEYVLAPGEFILGETFEYFGTDANYVIRLLNSSSIARVGISQAALGMINAGCGITKPIKLTLELVNNAQIPIKMRTTKINKDGKIFWGTEVLKVVVEKMDSKPEHPYDEWKFGVYSRDEKVTGTKMASRFDDKNLTIPKDSIYFNK